MSRQITSSHAICGPVYNGIGVCAAKGTFNSMIKCQRHRKEWPGEKQAVLQAISLSSMSALLK